ncbi:MAG TPA: pilus assembly protein CpaE [Chloroflexota bacterium]|nr:pilus assembly protein CpaE [Chloroflexota bacterium]HUM69020.1 pilus assembly protein CpaE [Chloroflexota bacterium]
MISLTLAKQLKEAGLVWQTAVNDFFAIPDRGMDDKVFVISDVMVTMELVQGWPALTFHGTAEWAADHLLTHEAIWLPTEEQLRGELERLLPEKEPDISLTRRMNGYHCEIVWGERPLTFSANTAGETYALALLHLLSQQT